MVEDTRPKDVGEWRSFPSSAVRFPVIRWSEFAQHPTETEVDAPTPCFHCKQKVGIRVESPLLQAGGCGGIRRKSLETECTHWGDTAN